MALNDLTAVGGGLDLRQYSPIMTYVSAGTITVNTWNTVYNNTGSGYISSILFIGTSSESFGVKITVDGTVVFRSVHADGSSGNATGIISLPSILHDSTNGKPIGWTGTSFNWLNPAEVRALPYLNSTDFANSGNSWAPMSQPLFFNTSLKVEVCSPTNTSPLTKISIVGGLKV